MYDDFDDHVLTLPAIPGSVAEARRAVREAAEGRAASAFAESAELAVSEVVTNALVHAGTVMELSVSVRDGGIRVAVSDGSPHLPARRGYSMTAGTGRGLVLVEEVVDEWGVTSSPHGKTVWFAIGSAADGLHGDWDGNGEGARHRLTGLGIQLWNVPVLLHAAWQEHAEALLREYLLVQLDDDPERAIERHAQAHDAMALLAATIPAPPPGGRAVRDLVGDGLPDVPSADVSLFLPPASVAHFARLDEMLEDADGDVRHGYLTAPVQPELQQLRRWLCRQVLEQSQGSLPTPWRLQQLDVEPVPDDEPEAALVRSSAGFVMLVDDAGGIVAASRPLEALLGYDEDALAGRRLLAIIPPRLREAHIAGFTRHFLNDRDVMLTSPVVVPAVRSDGAEIALRARIEAETAGTGRCRFRGTFELA